MTRTSLNAKGLARRNMPSISNVPSAMGVYDPWRAASLGRSGSWAHRLGDEERHLI